MSHLGEVLSAYLDGEADADEVELVVEHLGSCDACQTEMEALVSARRAVRSLPLLELPVALHARPVDGGARRPWRVAIASAAAVAVLASAIALGSTETVPVEEVVAPHVELARSGGWEVGP